MYNTETQTRFYVRILPNNKFSIQVCGLINSAAAFKSCPGISLVFESNPLPHLDAIKSLSDSWLSVMLCFLWPS